MGVKESDPPPSPKWRSCVTFGFLFKTTKKGTLNKKDAHMDSQFGMDMGGCRHSNFSPCPFRAHVALLLGDPSKWIPLVSP